LSEAIFRRSTTPVGLAHQGNTDRRSMEILVFNPIAHVDSARLQRDFPDLTIREESELPRALACCGEAQALIALAHFVEDPLIAAMPRLRWICSLTSGTDHLATLPSLKPDVRITSGRGIHGPQMAELTFLYMLALVRRIDRIREDQEQHVWDRRHQTLLWSKTMVIAGVGAISEELALRCKAFGMTTIGVSDSRKHAPGFDAIVPRAQLVATAARADFLVALVPLNKDTVGMFDAAVFAAMKPSAIFVNVARGPVVDEPALLQALKDGRIAGAGLDVFETEPLPPDHPLWQMPNVIITPRIGGMSDVYDKQVHPLVVHNLRCFIEGRMDEMKNIVR
jgi:phosphoglycerate dehydrogenase-like enzyme